MARSRSRCPAFVATLSICIVFVSVVFLTGPAKYLFTPLALAVVFAMMTSYLLSRTLVPVMVHFLLGSGGGRCTARRRRQEHGGGRARQRREKERRDGGAGASAPCNATTTRSSCCSRRRIGVDSGPEVANGVSRPPGMRSGNRAGCPPTRICRASRGLGAGGSRAKHGQDGGGKTESGRSGANPRHKDWVWRTPRAVQPPLRELPQGRLREDALKWALEFRAADHHFRSCACSRCRSCWCRSSGATSSRRWTPGSSVCT